MALSLGQIVESHFQQEPTFKTSLAYTRLTAISALEKLKEQGFSQEQLPCASTMAQVLNRMGYGLRKVVKVKPQKKLYKRMISSTTSKNLSPNQQTSLKVKRLSIHCKATVMGVIFVVEKPEETIKLSIMIWDAQKNILPVGFLMKIVGNYSILTLVVLLIKPGILLLIL